MFENDPDPRIRVGYDAQARTITVSDNGIGMSRPGWTMGAIRSRSVPG